MCFLWCLHALLSSTLQDTRFLGVLTYPIAVHVTGDAFLGRVDIPHCCIRYRWCVSCACWHTPMLYTLQVMCFLDVLTYPNAVHVTGDVFPGCVGAVLPAGCGHVAHLWVPCKGHGESSAAQRQVHTAQHTKELIIVLQNHHQRQKVLTAQHTKELITVLQNHHQRQKVLTAQHTKELITVLQNHHQRQKVQLTHDTEELQVAVIQNRK